MTQSIDERKTHLEQLIEVREGTTIRDLLEARRGKSQLAIAAELGIDRRTVAYWLAKYGIGRDAA